jgi:hypothetical protein
MPIQTAQSFAWNLATSLMTCVILFRTADGYGALPTLEFDGDPLSIVTGIQLIRSLTLCRSVFCFGRLMRFGGGCVARPH